MLKTMTALSLGFLLAGAAAANAGEASRTLRHELHGPRAFQLEILDPRAFALTPAPMPAATETDGLSRNPADCVKYICIDGDGDGG